MEYLLSGCVIGGVEQMSPGYAGCAKHKRTKGLLLIFLFIIIGLHVALGASVSAQDEVLSRPVVYIVNIEGTIEPGLASYVKRVLSEAENAQADAYHETCGNNTAANS
jgi:hypothetical protein